MFLKAKTIWRDDGKEYFLLEYADWPKGWRDYVIVCPKCDSPNTIGAVIGLSQTGEPAIRGSDKADSNILCQNCGYWADSGFVMLSKEKAHMRGIISALVGIFAMVTIGNSPITAKPCLSPAISNENNRAQILLLPQRTMAMPIAMKKALEKINNKVCAA